MAEGGLRGGGGCRRSPHSLHRSPTPPEDDLILITLGARGKVLSSVVSGGVGAD